MGNDDVRARAEALLDAVDGAAAPRCSEPECAGLCVKEAADALRAARAAEAADASASPVDATAVAPATAQPGAWAMCFVPFGHDDTAAQPKLLFDTKERAEDVARRQSAFGVGRGARFIVRPMTWADAAPPAPGDAAAVRERASGACRTRASSLYKGGQMAAGLEATKCADMIDAIPLPAPATAVEEALGCDLAGRPFADLLDEAAAALGASGGGPLEDCLRAKAQQIRAAEAAATHAAKEAPVGSPETWPFKDGTQYPSQGERVVVRRLGSTEGFLIHGKHLLCRKVGAVGTATSYVPGHGGDVWFVQHDDGSVGAYCYDELESIETTPTPHAPADARPMVVGGAFVKFDRPAPAPAPSAPSRGGEPVAWACMRRDGTFIHDDDGELATTRIGGHVGWTDALDLRSPKDAPHTLVALVPATSPRERSES